MPKASIIPSLWPSQKTSVSIIQAFLRCVHRVRQLPEDLETRNAIERLHAEIIEDGIELFLGQFCSDLADASHSAKADLHGPEDYLLQLLVGDVARAAHPSHSLEDVLV